jgi:hypothetical protein
MLNWLRTHRKWLVPTGIATVLISLLFSFTLHLQHRKQEERNGPAIRGNEKKSAVPDGQGIPQDNPKLAPDLPPNMIPEDKISGFSRDPSPDELTRKLEIMDDQERKTEEKKFAEMRVVWPL